MEAIQELGHGVRGIDTQPGHIRDKECKFANRLWRKLFGPLDLASANSRIEQAVHKQAFDIIWIDKVLTIKPGTLKRVKQLRENCIIVGYSPDDMTGNKRNSSRRYLRSLPYYDVYFTTKTYCVAELEALGCPRAKFVGNAYDEHTHRPMAVTSEDSARFGGPVGFIGAWEKERAESLCFLSKSGIRVRVWGLAWTRCKRPPELLILENKPLWSKDYARALCAFDINLCFLCKANRDVQTTRSIEIPACGRFMLAERTDEHLSLFEEGKEAEFFDSDEELLDKVRYYLAHPKERKRIAAAGRQRCLRSGYSNLNRMQEMMKIVAQL
jgi:hypothetical protein